MDASRPPSGKVIWEAIKEELTNNLYPLPFSTLAPTLYHVYLHPDDYEAIEGVVPRIVGEIANALTKEVDRLNQEASGVSRWRSLLRQSGDSSPIEAPPGGWEVYIQPDQDGELGRGTLGIVSKLTMPAPPEYGGTPTIRVVKTVVSPTGHRSSTVRDLEEPASASPASSTSASLHDVPPNPAPPTTRWSVTTHATLSYHDDDGDHVFPMRKDSIKIGRGGTGAWVDVQLITDPKVSREHCWIRADPGGRFFIQDVSAWGTSVNGARIPAPDRSEEGVVVQPGGATELPDDAAIGLADTLVLRFRADRQS
jgi:hypothetical protein